LRREREPSLIVCRQVAHAAVERAFDRRYELGAVFGLPSRRRHHDVDLFCVVRSSCRVEPLHRFRRRGNRSVGKPAVDLDLVCEAEPHALSVHGLELRSVAACDHEADGVRPDVDDGSSAGHSRMISPVSVGVEHEETVMPAAR
jgi:hypothetical protein